MISHKRPTDYFHSPSDHGGHVSDGAGAVGGAAQVHVAGQGQVPDLPGNTGLRLVKTDHVTQTPASDWSTRSQY